MNLLPLNEKKQARFEYLLRFWTVAGMATIVLLVAAATPLIISYFTISYNVDFIKDVAENLSKSEGFKKTDTVAKIIKDVNRKSAILNDPLSTTARQDLLSSFSFVFKTADKMRINQKGIVKIKQIIYEQVVKKGSARTGSVASTTASATSESGIHKINIKGFSATRDGFLSFLKELESNKNFVMIDSPVSNLVNSENLDFSLTITLKDKAI
ncbi:MAG TPA: hypothetical protein P5056_01420 [Candidatus Paceibacterota bacterium]|nr:hypothetical protein [Candidatus Paceibacterota bacterium]